MNKRGQELASWEFVKGVILLILIMILLTWAYRGIPDSKLNPIKAEDLSLSVSSVFIADNDLNLDYELGGEYYVDVEGDYIRLYKSKEGARGVSELFLDEDYNFGEQLNTETKINHVDIRKERNRLVISQ